MRPSSAPAPKRGPRSSRTSRSSIIGSACTQPWAIALQPKPGPAWRRSRCARQHDILIASLHSQGGSPLTFKIEGLYVSFDNDRHHNGAFGGGNVVGVSNTGAAVVDSQFAGFGFDNRRNNNDFGVVR